MKSATDKQTTWRTTVSLFKGEGRTETNSRRKSKMAMMTKERKKREKSERKGKERSEEGGWKEKRLVSVWDVCRRDKTENGRDSTEEHEGKKEKEGQEKNRRKRRECVGWVGDWGSVMRDAKRLVLQKHKVILS